MDWKIADAERDFSSVVDKALHEGPQRVLRDNETVVVISEDAYHNLKAHEPKRNDFVEYLMSGPGLEDLDLRRDKSTMREVDL